jgi:hypothetical protein
MVCGSVLRYVGLGSGMRVSTTNTIERQASPRRSICILFSIVYSFDTISSTSEKSYYGY